MVGFGVTNPECVTDQKMLTAFLTFIDVQIEDYSIYDEKYIFDENNLNLNPSQY